MLLYWLWLANRPNVSDGVKCALMRQFSDPQDVYFASEEELRQVPGMTRQALEALKSRELEDGEKILEDCARLNIHVLTMKDHRYPRRLRGIYDAPLLLYYKGTLPEVDALASIGVVGTRKPSVYGLQMAQRMGAALADRGALVVSGLAKGIDGAAMMGALNQGVAAVGVLGCGADVVYPKSNRELFLQTECQGCILTEYAPGTPPHAWNFPRRNRIISGLSCGVVVVEAPEKSGALLTARMALVCHSRKRGYAWLCGQQPAPAGRGHCRQHRRGCADGIRRHVSGQTSQNPGAESGNAQIPAPKIRNRPGKWPCFPENR